jgi:hypothetical protein
MNGGSAEVAFYVDRGFSAIADFTGEHSANINEGSEGLSLVSYTAGPRFTYPVHRHYGPFAQALVRKGDQSHRSCLAVVDELSLRLRAQTKRTQAILVRGKSTMN